MKLDQALKLYIGLYCLCFMFSWFVSIPMIIHVSRDGECLLFVSPYITYGPAAGKQNGHMNIVIRKVFDITLCMKVEDVLIMMKVIKKISFDLFSVKSNQTNYQKTQLILISFSFDIYV